MLLLWLACSPLRPFPTPTSACERTSLGVASPGSPPALWTRRVSVSRLHRGRRMPLLCTVSGWEFPAPCGSRLPPVLARLETQDSASPPPAVPPGRHARRTAGRGRELPNAGCRWRWRTALEHSALACWCPRSSSLPSSAQDALASGDPSATAALLPPVPAGFPLRAQQKTAGALTV